MVLTKEIGNVNEDKVISPLIFGRTTELRRVVGKMAEPMLILERLLDCVYLAYFDNSFTMRNLTEESQIDFDEDYSDEPVPAPRRKGRKRKNERTRARPVERNRRISKKKKGNSQEKANFSNKFMLDYLVSPLKVDLVMGKLSRVMEPEGDRYLRGRHMRLWEAVQEDQ